MLVSVVTVCRNAADTIEETVLSVLSQRHTPLEYIVVDGNSSDNTMEILTRYRGRLSRLVSQADNGIYDAMNHALNMCRGEYVLFLNSGDTFADEYVLQRMAEMTNGIDDVYFGDCNIIGLRRHVRHRPYPNRPRWQGNSVCHQTVLMRNRREYRFDLRYSLAADYELLCRIERLGGGLKHLPLTVCNYRTGGQSDCNPEVIRQWRRISQKYFPGINSTAHFRRLLVVTVVKRSLKRLLEASRLYFL